MLWVWAVAPTTLALLAALCWIIARDVQHSADALREQLIRFSALRASTRTDLVLHPVDPTPGEG